MKRNPIGAQLADLIRTEIVHERIPSDTHMVEDALADRFDVSRGPVRDALKALSAEGLLVSKRRGYYVKGVSPKDIEDLYALRGAIEKLAFELAIENSDEGSWGSADQALAGMVEAANEGSWHDFARHDLEFHGHYYVLSNNSRLLAVWEQYRPLFGAIIDVTNEQDEDLHPSAEDHRLLLQDSRHGNTAEVIARLTSHLDGSRDRMLRRLVHE